LGKVSLVREPEIKLKRTGSSADLQAASRTIAHAMGEPIGRVVVIEDEQPVRDAILAALRAERFTATGFEDLPRPADVLALAPDLAILDVLLPSGNGFALARLLRERRELPIIFLTARDAVADRVAGLELGADDYLVKPFALEELMARVRAVLRRLSFDCSHFSCGIADRRYPRTSCSPRCGAMTPTTTTLSRCTSARCGESSRPTAPA
jgi:DNA-binding response OmpR family regulator